jgi:WD40 repeat protein/serine/threonine protein kinase
VAFSSETPPQAPAGMGASSGDMPAVHAPEPALHPGTRINQYEIIKILGKGGMGTVFLARDLRLGRRVAIKVLQTNRPEQTKRLLAEARATARCQHDNIVVIHEVGEHNGVPYIVLEYLDGRPLTALTKDGQRLPYTRAIELMCSVVRALQCAHEAGIVHRDLKPDNIFVTDAGTVKVLDFGIAKVLHQPPQGPQIDKASDQTRMSGPGDTGSTDDLTRERESDGAVVGTRPYMSPEQWGIGIPIDHLTDIWACGILLYQMICGRHPLQMNQLIITVAIELPMPSIAEAAPLGVPRELIQIVDRCLCKIKEQRWQSATELLAALIPFLPGYRTIDLQVDESPYAGLSSFQEGDAGKFFGRNQEIAELVTKIRDQPLLAVVGSSGVGKSSFVRAGVIPALKRSGEPWEALIIRPGRTPIEALASMIQPMVARAANLADDVEAQRKLVETLHREPGHLGDVLRLRSGREQRRLLVFVDQFEELYTQVADPAKRAAFTACLSAVADDATSPLRVVLSMRSDFLDRVAEDRRFLGALMNGLFFLGRPGRASLRDAIANPAELAGYQFELPAIIDDMLAHLEATPGALPLLQFAAARLWDTRDRARRLLTQASYAAMGGVAGALASHADRVVSELGPQKAALVRAILLRLVTAERTRAIVPVAELRELSREDGEVPWLIEQMVDARLLVVQTVEGGKGTTVEIVHESLVHGWPTLRRWLDEHQDDAALVEQLRTSARQWAAKGRDRGLLWRGDALAEYQRWRRRHTASLLPLEAAFGAASVADAARGRRIRQLIVAVAVVTTAVFVAALWRANLGANRAQHEAEGLLRDSYFEQGRLRVLEGDKLGALAPLATAYRMGSTGPAARLLIEEAARSTRARLLTLAGHTDKLWGVAYSPDGAWLATASSDNTARVWDAATGALRATVHHADRVTTLAVSPDSRLVASGGSDHTVRVWDVIAGREVAKLPADTGTRKVAFSPDGSVLLAAPAIGVVKLWRMPGGTPAGELGWLPQVAGAAFCDNGACIVTWSADKLVIWDAATLAQRASYQQPGRFLAAAVSHTGALIAIGTESGELVLLRGDGSLIAKRAAHDDVIFDVAISPDEAIVATGSNDRTVRLWNARGEPLGILAGHRANITGVRFTPAGDRLVTTSADNTARLWSTSGMLLGELTGHTNLIIAAAIRADGARLATASWDHTVRVWDLARAEELRPIIAARDDSPPAVAFDLAGDRLAVARTYGTLSIVDLHTGAVTCTTSPAAAIERMVWIGSEQVAAVRRGGQAVELWNARCTQDPPLPHPALITAMSTRSGPHLVTAAGNVVRVWSRGRLEASLSGYTGTLDVVGADGDDVYATTLKPATVVVDAIGASAQRRIFRAGTTPLTDVRFDRALGQVVATSWDQFLYVWDATTGTLVRKLEGTGPLGAVRTSPDGTITIGFGGFSPTIWDGRSGARKGQLDGHSALVRDGGFIHDQIFVSIAWNHTAFVWDVAAARPLMTFHDVETMVFSNDLRSVAIVGATGVRVWSPRLPPPDLDALRALHVQ